MRPVASHRIHESFPPSCPRALFHKETSVFLAGRFDEFVNLEAMLTGLFADSEALALHVLASDGETGISDGFHVSIKQFFRGLPSVM